MKKFLLSMLFAVLTCCASLAQQPIYNPGAGTFSWTISEDTTQQMLGCPGNNYNAEGQCETGMQWYYHTGKVAITIKNKRTGITYSAAQTVTGGVATAAVTVPVLPGDVLSYTETQQVYCPVTGVWGGPSNVPGNFEIAYTRFHVAGQVNGVPTVGQATYNIVYDCANTPYGIAVPDFVTNHIVYEQGSFDNLDIDAVCYSPTGGQPWSCVPVEVVYAWPQDPGAGICTYNP